tara:strand:+ start:762 stop:1097 length:336 start_codon:yes stop_codon:yes gene_type:complete
MKNLFFIATLIFMISCQNKSTQNEKVSSDVTVCFCLETRYSKLTSMSVKEFDLKCDKLFKDLGINKALKRTKNCDLKKIQEGAFKGEVITSIDDLNALISLFFYEVIPEDL